MASGVSRTNIAFQSTPPSRGVTTLTAPLSLAFTISIHTPLAGSDILVGSIYDQIEISIHTPLAGSDLTDSVV